MFISMVMIPAKQLGIRAYVYEYLGLEGLGLRPWSLRYKNITAWYSSMLGFRYVIT